MAIAIRIRDWSDNFEVAQSRKIIGALAWVGVPTKHDGKSFRRLIRLPNGPALFGCWVLLVQIAAKCPTRGVLADDDGPLTPEDLSDKTGCPSSLFVDAIHALCSREIGWLEECDWSSDQLSRTLTLFSDNSSRPVSTPIEPIDRSAVVAEWERAPDTKPTKPTEQTNLTGALPAPLRATQGARDPRALAGGTDTAAATEAARAGHLKNLLDKVRKEHLPNTAAMIELQPRIRAIYPELILPGDDGLFQLLCAAERGLECGANPPALFRSLIQDQRWNLISPQQKRRAQDRLCEYLKTAKVAERHA